MAALVSLPFSSDIKFNLVIMQKAIDVNLAFMASRSHGQGYEGDAKSPSYDGREMLRDFSSGSQPSSKLGPCRLIVYNKKDLADRDCEQPLKEAFKKHGQTVFFTSSRVDDDVRKVLLHAQELTRANLLMRYGHNQTSDRRQGITKISSHPKPHSVLGHTRGMKIMFCGMPNVGKSSLLNALRRVGCHKAKAASEAPMPGHTRSVGGLVKIADGSPSTSGWPVYAFDTPGIMPPYLGFGSQAAERAFKMALTAGIKESLFDNYDLASYLLHIFLLRYSSSPRALEELSSALKLTSACDFPSELLDPSQPLPIEQLLLGVADRVKALKAGGSPDLDAAAQWMLKCFRDGRFGGWTLDDVGQLSLFKPAENNKVGPPARCMKLLEDDSQRSALSRGTHPSTTLSERVGSLVSHYLSSLNNAPPSKTAVKMAARRAGKELQRAQSQLQKVKRRARSKPSH
ncbi:hypothetical protein O181_066067 [Austropuccinia psidii MF-1]|uniref:G domain-containing protein n=1 Tax=Austropuccinia psidii MF-1 TaxID=1389203 RepID=A0A9Q3EYH9_9BASI|nr:hypothetical protein [Austropuccinia psidii MF-1]